MPDYNIFGNERSIYDFLPGNSGEWGDTGLSPGYSPAGGVRPGMGLPGDRYRVATGQKPLSPTLSPVMQTMPAIWDPNRALYVNPQSGQPFTGKLPSGQYATSGRVTGAPPVAPPAGPVNPATGERTLAPSQQYSAVSVPKQPDVSAATADLLNTFKTTAAASLKDFGSYLNDFKAQLGGAKTAATAAENINPTVDALAGDQAEYARRLNQSGADYAALNKDVATQERGAVTEARGLLPSYDAAAQAIADRQMQSVVGNLSRYKMGTGTPRSAGTDESRILAQAASDVYLPLERDKINKRYDIISNLDLPVTRDLAGRETSRIAQFDPMVAGQIFQSGQATVKDVQNLRTQVRDMTYQDAVRFMQSIGVPAQVQQQILQGQITELGGISNLETLSNYQGLQDLTGASLTPANYYNLGTPSLPTFSRYAPTQGTGTGGGGGLRAGDAPVEVSGTTSANSALSAEVQKWTAQGLSPQRALARANAIDPNTGLPNWVLNQRYEAGWKTPYQNAYQDAPQSRYPSAPVAVQTDPLYGSGWGEG